MVRAVIIALMIVFGVFVCACADDTPVEVPAMLAGADYLWNTPNRPLTYETVREGRHYRHLLTLKGDGGIEDLVTDEYAQTITRTAWRFSRSEGTVNDCSPLTLWYLPSQLRQSVKAVYAPGPVIRSSCILCLDDSNLVVGTEADGLFHYSASRSEWYTMPFPGSGAISAIAKDDTEGDPLLFAATVSEGIFKKHRLDPGWDPIATPAGIVQDIEISDTTTLFAVIDNALWFTVNPFSDWVQIPLGKSVGKIQSIALLRISGDEEILFVATSNSGLLYIRLVDSFPTLVQYYNTRGYQSIRCINTMQNAPYPAVGIAPPSTLFVAPAFGLWISIPLTVAELHCVSQSMLSGVVLIGTDDGLYRYNGINPARISLSGQNVRNLATTAGNTFYAGTDAGFFRSRSEGETWTRIDGGMVLTGVRHPWTILPARFTSGDSWQAAVLLDSLDVRHEVTGRILSVVDELVLPSGSNRYLDAIVVRYACETASGAPEPGSYCWHAYFVRGKGLVCLEESVDGSTIGTSVLLP